MGSRTACSRSRSRSRPRSVIKIKLKFKLNHHIFGVIMINILFSVLTAITVGHQQVAVTFQKFKLAKEI